MSNLISRQAAIDAIGEKSDEIYKTKQKGATYPHNDFFQGMAYAADIVKNMPSAQPVIRTEMSSANDTISRQEAILAIERNAYRHTYVDQIVDIIKWLPSAQPHWIPCSERLPEEETDVLICNANGDIAISRGSYSTEAEDDFIWYTSGWRFGKVIAWMPLPEPYKEERREE